jgi:predicted AAA+ superfamily ATPase
MIRSYHRLIEDYLRKILQDFPAVTVEGLKGVGKTVSCERLSNGVFKLDREIDRVKVSNNPDMLAGMPTPVLIDEWQKVPSVWEFVRRKVDEGANPGSYLLTGSIANSNRDIHSGAGRIIRVQMRPLSLAERGTDNPSVSLGALLNAAKPFSRPVNGETGVSYSDYMTEIVSSGLPGVRRLPERRRRQLLDSFLDNLLSHEFQQQRVRVRQPQTILRWLRAYAAAVATDAGYTEILDASTAGEHDKPDSRTTAAYREALRNLWLLDEIPAWVAGNDYHSRLKKTPRHYLADPALAAALLDIDLDTLAGTRTAGEPGTRFDEKNGNIIGRLFQSLVQQSLGTYALVNDAKVSYLRTQNGDREIDFIIQHGRKIIAVEVKLSQTVEDADVRNLLWFRELVGARLTDAMVVYSGGLAYRRKDGIAVVPAALLGA